MDRYEKPEVLASYSVKELVEEAAECTTLRQEVP